MSPAPVTLVSTGAALLCFLTGLAAVWAHACRPHSDAPWPALRGHRAQLTAELAFVRAPIGSADLVAGQLICTAVLACLATALWHPWPLLAVPLVAVGPGAVVDQLATRRRRRIEDDLDGWLVTLANSLHSTPALTTALETSARNTRGPLAEEIERVLSRHRLGTPLEDGLSEMAARVESRALSGAVLLMRLAVRTGGNLPATLQSTAGTLREIARLEGVVRTKTAEGRGQTRLIAMLPMPLLGAVHFVDPSFLAPLAASARGHAVVGGALLLWSLAIVAARRIVRVEV